MRFTVRQSGAAVPIRINENEIGTEWKTVLEAPDFSVPDTQRRFINDRDPADDERRIQPGFALIEAPLMFFNTGVVPVVVDIRILDEDNNIYQQASINIIGRDTFLHPAPGQRLLKLDKDSSNGDRLQVKATIENAIILTSSGSVGAAEQNEPELV